MPDSRPQRNANGQFLQGTSGNPGGRPAHAAFTKKVRELVGKDGAKLAEFAWAVMLADVEKLKPILSKEDALLAAEDVRFGISVANAAVPAIKERLAAMQFLKDGGFGKSPENVVEDVDRYAEMSDVDVVVELLRSVTPEKRAEALQKLASGEVSH